MLLIEAAAGRRGRAAPSRSSRRTSTPGALELARAGLYPESIAADVTPERLRRFFVAGGAQLSRRQGAARGRWSSRRRTCWPIRRSPGSTSSAAATSSCTSSRSPAAGPLAAALRARRGRVSLPRQRRDDRRAGGPVRGRLEEVADLPPRRADAARQGAVPRSPCARDPARPCAGRAAAAGRRAGSAARSQQLLLERYVPACVVINRKGEILHFSGPTHDYLVQPAGPPTQDLIAQARDGLQTKLRAAVRKAIRDGDAPVAAPARASGAAEACRRVQITVEPLEGSRETEGLLLVSFEDEPPARTPVPRPPPGSPPRARRADRPPARGRAEDDARGAAEHHRGAAELQPGAAGLQRRGHVGQRGAPVAQRGARRPRRRSCSRSTRS